MGSVWKRLQRVNKRAAKFQFTASYHELTVVNSTSKWRPSNLSIVWTRRSRRVASTPHPWEPDMIDSLKGNIRWPVPDNNTISVTLFKDPRTYELEDKDWTFVVEDVSSMGKKRVLASANINMRKYASELPTQQTIELILKPVSRKIVSAQLELTLSCVFLREGKATDEDMQSIVSLLSVNNNHDHDIAPLDDLEDIPDMESNYELSEHVLDFTAQLEQLTNSLTGSEVATPMSVPSLTEDPTPLAEHPHFPDLPRHDHSNGRPGAAASKTPSSGTSTARNSRDMSHAVALGKLHSSIGMSADVREPPEVDVDERPPATATTAPADSAKKTLAANARESFFESQNNVRNVAKHTVSTPHAHTFLKHAEREASKTTPAPAPATTITTKTHTLDQSKPTVFAPTKLTAAPPAIATPAAVAAKPEVLTEPVDPADKPSSETVPKLRAAELPPLNLKKSYENGGAADSGQESTGGGGGGGLSVRGSIGKSAARDRTPGQDLLEWCKEVTADYPGVKVTNLTTSWRNGMAFCAVVHHFQPELVNMSQLTAHDVVGNCRAAFDAAERLGIPRVIEPRDMSRLAVPDKLAVMTYLYQLRAHFTGHQLQLEQIGSTADESSYVIGNYKSDNHLPAVKLDHLKMMHQQQQQQQQRQLITAMVGGDGADLGVLGGEQAGDPSPERKPDATNSKHRPDKALRSPSKEKVPPIGGQPANRAAAAADKPAVLMTRRELTDPFGSDEEEGQQVGEAQPKDQQNGAASDSATATPNEPSHRNSGLTLQSPSLDAATTNKLLSRHKEMSAKAKAMMERLNSKGPAATAPTDTNGGHSSSSSKPSHQQTAATDVDEDRQVRLREHARRLIAETRARSHNLDSPTSPIRLITQRIALSPERTISPIHAGAGGGGGSPSEGVGFFADQTGVAAKENSPSRRLSAHLQRTARNSAEVEAGTAGTAAVDEPSAHSRRSSPAKGLSERNGNTPMEQQLPPLLRASPQREKKLEQLSYIESELEALECEQQSIDLKASALEKKLRVVMGGGNGENPDADETEEQLLAQWFTLVNKKNALLRRQMQLNILEQENDLERKYAMLNRELRAALSVEDWRKSEAQRDRERLLLDELVGIVDKRNELVLHLHNQEKAIEDDDEIERELEHVDITAKDKCAIQ